MSKNSERMQSEQKNLSGFFLDHRMSTIKDVAMGILLAMLLLTGSLSTPIISTVSTGTGVTRTAQIKHNYSGSKNFLLNRTNARCVLCCD